MRRDALLWAGIALLGAAFGTVTAFGTSGAAIVFVALLATAMLAGVGFAMRSAADEAWLPRWVVLGYLAKIAGTLARYYMVAVFYRVGDSFRYYQVGTELAAQWRAGIVPGLTNQGAFGTQVVEAITGGMFAIFTPDLLGGFLVFATISYLGQLMLYSAFRQWAQPHQLKPYALLIFLLPTYAFWPSSIGKDALVIFALGGFAYFAARALKAYEVRWLLGLAAFLAVLGLIRIHVAGLIAIGLIGASLIARMPAEAPGAAGFRRIVFLVGSVGVAALVLTLFPDIFGVDLTQDEALEAFTSDVVRRTSESGTIASGDPVTGPADLPRALALVLFRPFIFEATEIQHYLAAAETSLILGLTLWKLGAVARNWRKWRANAYIVFATFYVVGFAVAFSVVRNLGIIARQRGQVLALFLCVLISLGWEERKAVAKPQLQVTRARVGVGSG